MDATIATLYHYRRLVGTDWRVGANPQVERGVTMALRSKRKDAPNDDPLQPDLPPEEEMPDKPVELGGRGWVGTLTRTIREFQGDNLSDWAAALTYYGVLSIFPGIIVLLSVFSMVSDESTATRAVDEVAPDKYAETINNFIRGLQDAQGSAGILAIVGLLGALWSASGYVGAFMRASNAIYDVPEGRPIWKTVPTRLAVTIVVGVMLVISAFIVVFTGGVAERIGDFVGLGKGAVLVWDILKWPVLVALVSLMFAILYWASPNAKHGGFRWVSPGGVLAVLIWIVVSAGFALYLANFANYNKTYGALGGVIAFLVWLWISNIAVLLGAEFDAELERGRAIKAGHPADEEPFVELRDTRKVKKGRDQDLE
jgi:membrane protein